MSVTVQEISSAIRSIVASGGELPGSRLAAVLQERQPGWRPADFGARSLREFVAANVTGVVVVGRAGMDVIYGLEGAKGPASPEAALLPPVQPDFWRIWVSSNSPYVLLVDRTSAVVKAVPRGTSATEDEILLVPPDVDVHRSVAQEFLARVSDGSRARLQEILEQPLDRWWQSWVRELRGSSLLSDWNTFRRHAFEGRFRSQLLAAAMSEASSDRVLAEIRQRHLDAPQRRRSSLHASAEREDGEDIRRVVLEAVRRMSIAELRDLRLPLGVVLDVLASSTSR